METLELGNDPNRLRNRNMAKIVLRNDNKALLTNLWFRDSILGERQGAAFTFCQ